MFLLLPVSFKPVKYIGTRSEPNARSHAAEVVQQKRRKQNQKHHSWKKKNNNQNNASTDNLSTRAGSRPQLRTGKGLEMVKQLQAKPHLLREIASYLQWSAEWFPAEETANRALKVFNATQRKEGNGKQTPSAIKNAASFFNKKSTNMPLLWKRHCSHRRLGSSQQHGEGCLMFLIRGSYEFLASEIPKEKLVRLGLGRKRNWILNEYFSSVLPDLLNYIWSLFITHSDPYQTHSIYPKDSLAKGGFVSLSCWRLMDSSADYLVMELNSKLLNQFLLFFLLKDGVCPVTPGKGESLFSVSFI